MSIFVNMEILVHRFCTVLKIRFVNPKGSSRKLISAKWRGYNFLSKIFSNHAIRIRKKEWNIFSKIS